MTLLNEYALTPGIFDEDNFPAAAREDVIYGSFALLREVFNNDGIVRNLCGGSWQHQFRDTSKNWHFKGKDLLRKIIEQNRLVVSPQILASVPTTDKGWCEEALASHGAVGMCGIVTTDTIAAQYASPHPQIASISRLASSQWWSKRDGDEVVYRTMPCYLDCLKILLNTANFLSFIDANIDPRKTNYRGFPDLINAAVKRNPLPLIQIHRELGAGQTNWEAVFDAALGPIVRATGVKIEVFIWDELHDRYLMSDIIGISVPYGFDTTTRVDHMGRTTWTRLSRRGRDQILKDYDDAAHFQRFKGQNHYVVK